MKRSEIASILRSSYSIKEINSILKMVCEKGIYENEKMVIIAAERKSDSAYYPFVYEFDLEWK